MSDSGSHPDRGVSTVADVSLAIVVLVVAIGTLVAFADDASRSHDPSQGPQTVETLGASTLTVTYSVGPALDSPASPGDRDEYSDDELRRVSHGTLVGLAAAGTMANLSFGTGRESVRLSVEGQQYETVLDERFRASLVASSFETHLTAVWRPYEDAPVQGRLTLGQRPPPDVETSLTRLSVSSGVRPVREAAVAAVERDGDYRAVAELVAEAVVDGLLSEVESQRALERSGLERELVVYRYRRLAAVLDGVAPDDRTMRANLPRDAADARKLNDYLSDALARWLATDMESRFETAGAAARALELAELTVSVRTWDR